MEIIGWISGWLLVGYGVGGHLTHDVPRWKLAKARKNTCTGQPWRPPSSHSCHGASPLTPRYTTISRHATHHVYVVKTRKNNTYYYWFDYYVHNASLTTMRLQARIPHPHMGHLRQFQCNRSVLWTYWHHPVARGLPRLRRGRQTEHGQRGGDLGGSMLVNFLRRWAPLGAMAKFSATTTRVPLPWVLPVRGRKGKGRDRRGDEKGCYDRWWS